MADFSLWLGPYKLVKDGVPIEFDRKEVSRFINQKIDGKYLCDDIVPMRLKIGFGSGQGKAWGCDFSEQYIHINADYTT